MKTIHLILALGLMLLTLGSYVQSSPTPGIIKAYEQADIVRGGKLYDKWFKVPGVKNKQVPKTRHHLYPETAAQAKKTNGTTWRCKECHGWDYAGKDGAYAEGSHFSGIKGILDSSQKTPAELYSIIQKDHVYAPYLSDQDVADLIKFIKKGMLDLSPYVAGKKLLSGDSAEGKTLYAASEAEGGCAICHGDDGRDLNFKKAPKYEFLGGLTNRNPQETLHKTRWGHPGADMPSAVDVGLSIKQQMSILKYMQSLPKNPR